MYVDLSHKDKLQNQHIPVFAYLQAWLCQQTEKLSKITGKHKSHRSQQTLSKRPRIHRITVSWSGFRQHVINSFILYFNPIFTRIFKMCLDLIRKAGSSFLHVVSWRVTWSNWWPVWYVVNVIDRNWAGLAKVPNRAIGYCIPVTYSVINAVTQKTAWSDRRATSNNSQHFWRPKLQFSFQIPLK